MILLNSSYPIVVLTSVMLLVTVGNNSQSKTTRKHNYSIIKFDLAQAVSG